MLSPIIWKAAQYLGFARGAPGFGASPSSSLIVASCASRSDLDLPAFAK